MPSEIGDWSSTLSLSAIRLQDRLRPMGDRELRTLVEGGAYFEGPRWHDGRWWVSDFYRHAVLAIDPDGNRGDGRWRSRASRPGSAGCPTARCSSSRCSTTRCCAARRTAR